MLDANFAVQSRQWNRRSVRIEFVVRRYDFDGQTESLSLLRSDESMAGDSHSMTLSESKKDEPELGLG